MYVTTIIPAIGAMLRQLFGGPVIFLTLPRCWRFLETITAATFQAFGQNSMPLSTVAKSHRLGRFLMK